MLVLPCSIDNFLIYFEWYKIKNKKTEIFKRILGMGLRSGGVFFFVIRPRAINMN